MLRQPLRFAQTSHLWKVTSRHFQKKRGSSGSDLTTKKLGKSKSKINTSRHSKPARQLKHLLLASQNGVDILPVQTESGEKELFKPNEVEPQVNKETENIGEQLVGSISIGKFVIH